MRFNELDLNLLIALDALIEEQSVSAAAERMRLSQSAMSGALARLRVALGDQILVQNGRRMVPTPRCIELGPAVKDVLSRIERNVLTRPEFDPTTSRRMLSVMSSDFALSVGLSPALKTIARAAPGMRFEILPVNSDPFGTLDRGEIELLVIPEIYAAPDNPHVRLFEDEYVCVAWSDNQRLKSGLDADALCSLPHVVVEFERQRVQSAFDWMRQSLGRTPARSIRVSGYNVVPFLIAGTERISLMHSRLAAIYARMLPLRIDPLPIDLPKIVEVIQWKSANGTDEGLMWVVNTLVAQAGDGNGADS